MSKTLQVGTGVQAWGLLFVLAIGLSGCSDSGIGTAKIGTESREKILPQAGPKAASGTGSAPGKSFSIKDRGRVATPPAATTPAGSGPTEKSATP